MHRGMLNGGPFAISGLTHTFDAMAVAGAGAALPVEAAVFGGESACVFIAVGAAVDCGGVEALAAAPFDAADIPLQASR